MAEQKKKQLMRFTDEELSLIKNTFADNDGLLKALRKHFLQLELNNEDKSLLKNFITSKKDVIAVIRKQFLPTIDGEAPLHQVIDLWMTVAIKEKTPEQAYPLLVSRAKLIDFLDQRLLELEGKKILDSKLVSLKALGWNQNKIPINAYCDLMARNIAIEHTELQLSQFLVLGGLKEETVEQTKERLFKNSTK